MPDRLAIRKRRGWWWVSRTPLEIQRQRRLAFGVPFRTLAEAHDYALTVAPWPKWYNGRS